MFDLATRPVPATAAQLEPGVAFDLRLTASQGATNYSWSNYATATGLPVVTVDVLQAYAIAVEDTLQTAIIHSLFSDARAGDGDGIDVRSKGRRGWVGDEYQGADDHYGSLLWTVLVGKVTDDVLERTRFYAEEALAWMVRDGIAASVVVEALWVGDVLAIRPQIFKPDHVAPVYDVLWGTTMRRGAAA